MKQAAIILCLMLSLFVSNSDVAFAADPQGVLIKEEMNANLQQIEEEANLTDSIMVRFFRYIFQAVPIASMDTLIFGNPYYVWIDKATGFDVQKMEYGLFPTEVYNKIIKPGVNIFAGAYFGFVTLAILLSSLKAGWRSLTPQGKADFWVDVQLWVFSGLFMLSTTILYDSIFEMNRAIVSDFGSRIPNKSAVSIIANSSGWKVGDLFVFFAEWGLSLYLNFIYISRLVVIVFLMILAVVAAISLLYPRTRPFFGMWVKELCGNVFLQSIHALVLMVMAGFASLGAGTMMKLGMIILFVPVTGLISRWLNLGDTSTKLGQGLTMAGLGGIAGAIMLTRQAKQVAGYAQTNAKGGSDTNMGSDGGSTGITEAAKGSSSAGWQRIKSAAGTAGMIAGATAGLPFGGMGAAVGGAIGNKLGRGMVQGPRNFVSSLGQTRQTLKDKSKDMKDGKFFGEWNDLSSKRDWYGRMGEAIGSIGGQTGSNIGRSMGHMLSGASRQRVQAEEFGNQTLLEYAANPEFFGANVEWRQDNQRSAFYAQSNKDGSWKRISAYGAADPTLRKGEGRVVDYKLNNGANWVRQENGSYQMRPSHSPAISAAPAPVSMAGGGHVPTGLPSTSASSGGGMTAISGSVPVNSVSPAGSPVSGGGGMTAIPGSTPFNSVSPAGSPASGGGGVITLPGNASTNTVGAAGASTSGGSNHVIAGQGSNQIVGLSGSTSYLGRQSGAYIVGTDNKRYEDRGMEAGKINPDQYFSHNIQGTSRRTASDIGADLTHRTTGAAKTAKAWAATGVRNTFQRARGLIG